MTKKTTELAQVKPACYCCLSDDNLTEKSNGKGLTYHLCDKCLDAGFQWIDDMCTLVCPTHGIRHHYDVENVKVNMRWASKGEYWYPFPAHTRRTKENGLKPIFGLCKYDERKVE